MNDFTLSNKDFSKLVESIWNDKKIFHIKIKGYGTSMSPLIKSGSVLTIRPVQQDFTVKTGDIVAVTDKNKEKIIVHRVIGTKNNLLQTKGDNCPTDDGWHKKERIIGIVTGIKTRSGRNVYYKPWQNLTIGFLSKTRLLNFIMLPAGRFIKKIMGGNLQ